MSNPTVVLAAVEPQEDTLRLRSGLDVLSSMFLVVNDTMDAVTRWAIAAVVGRLAAVTPKRLCHHAPD